MRAQCDLSQYGLGALWDETQLLLSDIAPHSMWFWSQSTPESLTVSYIWRQLKSASPLTQEQQWQFVTVFNRMYEIYLSYQDLHHICNTTQDRIAQFCAAHTKPTRPNSFPFTTRHPATIDFHAIDTSVHDYVTCIVAALLRISVLSSIASNHKNDVMANSQMHECRLFLQG